MAENELCKNYAVPNEMGKIYRLDRPNQCEIFANRSIGFVRLKLINLLNYRPRWKHDHKSQPKLGLTSCYKLVDLCQNYF